MATRRGRTRNTNDTAIISTGIALNSSTSTLIQVGNENRIFFSFSSPDSHNVWLVMQDTSIDNDKKGIFIPKNGYWEMPMDSIYTGEISAISVTGTPSVYPTEY